MRESSTAEADIKAWREPGKPTDQELSDWDEQYSTVEEKYLRRRREGRRASLTCHTPNGTSFIFKKFMSVMSDANKPKE